VEVGIARDPTTKHVTEAPRRALRIIERSLDVFVPEQLRLEGADTVKRARLIIAFSLVTAPFGPFFAAAYASFGMRVVGIGILVATIAALLNPLVLRRTGAMRVCEQLPALYIWSVITFISLYTGGVGTPSVYWLVTLPLFASVFRGGRAGLAWAGIAFLTYGSLWHLELDGSLPAHPLSPYQLEALHVASVFGLTLLVVFLMLFYHWMSESAVEDVEAARARLEAEIEHRKRARSELDELNRKLVDQARVVGRAETATNVLHNVGNALNRVNLLAATVEEGVKCSRVPKLRLATGLLDDNADDLASFLAHQERGAKLREYLSHVAELLVQERKDLLERVRELVLSLEHLKVTVHTQQGYARRTMLYEPVSVRTTVEDAIRFTGVADAPDIEFERQFAEMPSIITDRHRLMEILVNLLGNAKHAVRESGPEGRRIEIRVGLTPSGRWRMTVTDNGVGIAREHLDQVFQHGFTTKADGHGFGLHSGAIAAQEMGGSLCCSSDGPGRGACFVLELPLDPPAAGDGHDVPTWLPDPNQRTPPERLLEALAGTPVPGPDRIG
jgi:signal transduction histidine kinase